MIQRYSPMSKDELGYDMQASTVEDEDGDYVLFSDHKRAVAEMVKYKAFWDQARLTDKETFEHYEWKKWGKE